MNESSPNSSSVIATPAGLWARCLMGLSRVTSSGRYVPVIDGLRFVAIMAVMLFHLNESLVVSRPELETAARQTTLFHVLKVGNIGVPLFFAISGFILTLPFLEARESHQPFRLGRYFLRRVTRLEPPYIINLLLITALLILVRGESWQTLWAPLLASLCYVHNAIYGEMSKINCVAWSLEIEVQFYLLAPALALLLLSGSPFLRRAALLGLIVTLCSWKFWLQQTGQYPGPGNPASPLMQRLMLALPWHLEHFLVGMFLADVYFTSWRSSPSPHTVWDIAGLVCWPLLVLCQWRAATQMWLPLITIPAYIAAFRGPILNRLLSIPVVTVIGGMCYTLYLYHFYVISLVNKFTIARLAGWSYPAALSVQIALILPLTLLFGAILFRFIERPCMQWRPWSSANRSSAAGSSPELLTASGR